MSSAKILNIIQQGYEAEKAIELEDGKKKPNQRIERKRSDEELLDITQSFSVSCWIISFSIASWYKTTFRAKTDLLFQRQKQLISESLMDMLEAELQSWLLIVFMSMLKTD